MPRLTVRSQNDAEVLLIGGDLKLMQRSTGLLSADLPEGIYKVKCERGGGTVERLVDLMVDVDIALFVEWFPTIAPLGPVLGADARAVADVASAAMATLPFLPEGLANHVGDASEPGILVLAHRAADGDGGGTLSGFRLGPWSGCWDSDGAADLSALEGPRVEAAGDLWSAAWVPFRPGNHILDYASGTGHVQQAILVAPGWQTRIFLRRRRWPRQDAAGERRDSIEFSIQMARPHSEVVYSDHWETIEVVRNSLELGRPAIVSARLIEDLLTESLGNPVAAVSGLHLYLTMLDRQRAAGNADGSPPGFLDGAFKNLDRLLSSDGTAADPPDVIALKLRAGRLSRGRLATVTEPPMLWASWQALRDADPEEAVEVSPALWQQIAWASAWGPYLAWPDRPTTLDAFVEAHLAQLWSRGPKQDTARTWLKPVIGALTAATDTLFKAVKPKLFQNIVDLVRRPKSIQLNVSLGGVSLSVATHLEGYELARALGIPLSVLRSAKKGGREEPPRSAEVETKSQNH